MKRLFSWLPRVGDTRISSSDSFSVGALFDGELQASERHALEAKLSEDDFRLQRELESLRDVRKEVRNWFEETAVREVREKPLDVWQNIESVILADIRSKHFESGHFVSGFRDRLIRMLREMIEPKMIGAAAAACAVTVIAVNWRSGASVSAPVNLAGQQLVVHGGNSNLQVAQLANIEKDLAGEPSSQLIGGLSEKEADDLLARVGFTSPSPNFPSGIPLAESLAGRIVVPMMASHSSSMPGGVRVPGASEGLDTVGAPGGLNVSGGLRTGGADIEWIRTERPFRIVRSSRRAAPPVIWVAKSARGEVAERR